MAVLLSISNFNCIFKIIVIITDFSKAQIMSWTAVPWNLRFTVNYYFSRAKEYVVHGPLSPTQKDWTPYRTEGIGTLQHSSPVCKNKELHFIHDKLTADMNRARPGPGRLDAGYKELRASEMQQPDGGLTLTFLSTKTIVLCLLPQALGRRELSHPSAQKE